MADDPPVTKVTVTIPGVSVTIEAADPLTDVAPLALDMLRDARKLDTARPGAAIGYALQQQPAARPHRDKRLGGDIAPVRAGKPPADTSWIRSTETP